MRYWCTLHSWRECNTRVRLYHAKNKHLSIFLTIYRHNKIFKESQMLSFPPPAVRGAGSEMRRKWRTHWFEHAPNTGRPWQGCYNSRWGLYNRLITKAVSQTGAAAGSMHGCERRSTSSLPEWLIRADGIAEIITSRLLMCDSAARSRFMKVIGRDQEGSVPFPITWSPSNKKKKKKRVKQCEQSEGGGYVGEVERFGCALSTSSDVIFVQSQALRG